MRLAIIGGGVVGISIGIAALKKGADSVTVFDKESKLGFHASSRNSGVLHSGIYYTSDSLKARFSIEGNQELRELCLREDIPILESGKLILSRDQHSEDYLGELIARAARNGVEAQRLDKNELPKYQVGARTYESFLKVKKTAVSSPKLVLDALIDEFERLGGAWELNRKLDDLSIFHGKSKASKYRFDLIINSSGAQALNLAKTVGVGKEYQTTPFLGLYWGVDRESLPLNIPLYPTPHPINPFLGVHLTPTISGLTKIGPTAIPVLGKEQYSLLSGLSLKDTIESMSALARVAFGKKHSLSAIVMSEIPKFMRPRMIADALPLFDGLDKVKGWQAFPGGIRAQLVNSKGEFMQDFIVEKSDGIVHVLNAVSPGWTSALPFGRWIVDNYVFSESGDK